tara:strand:+ start:8391 stop:8693 length:303 start_codon:yes stop_codon:yes gene_type:complete
VLRHARVRVVRHVDGHGIHDGVAVGGVHVCVVIVVVFVALGCGGGGFLALVAFPDFGVGQVEGFEVFALLRGGVGGGEGVGGVGAYVWAWGSAELVTAVG